MLREAFWAQNLELCPDNDAGFKSRVQTWQGEFSLGRGSVQHTRPLKEDGVTFISTNKPLRNHWRLHVSRADTHNECIDGTPCHKISPDGSLKKQVHQHPLTLQPPSSETVSPCALLVSPQGPLASHNWKQDTGLHVCHSRTAQDGKNHSRLSRKIKFCFIVRTHSQLHKVDRT